MSNYTNASANLNSRLRQSYIPQYTWLVDWCCLQSKASKQTKQYRVSASLQPVSKYTNSNANLRHSSTIELHSAIHLTSWLLLSTGQGVKTNQASNNHLSGSLQPMPNYTNAIANLATRQPQSYILQYTWLVACCCSQVKASKKTKYQPPECKLNASVQLHQL